MANEITLTAALTLYKPSVMSGAISRNITGILYSMAGSDYTQGSFVASHTAANALPLGSVSGSIGWGVIINTDAVNAVQMYNHNSDSGVSTYPILQIPPLGFNVLTFYTGMVPYFLALTANVIVEYMLFNQ